MILGCPLQDPRGPEPRDPGTRQERVRWIVALPEREHDEAVVPGTDRVRELTREMGEAVARPDGERLFLLSVPLE